MFTPAETRHFDTVAALYDALGGIDAAAAFFDQKGQTVRSWRDRGYFPPRYFVDHARRLSERGWSASPSLWNQVEAAA